MLYFVLVVVRWKNTTLSEQLQNSIEKSYKETKLIPLTHKYITADFPSLVQALQ